MSMGKEENRQQKITRRDFLKLAGASFVGTTVGITSGVLWEKWRINSIPDNSPSEDLLRSTAVALVKENKKNQFIERGKFTKEFFDRCCRGTFALEILKGELFARGTCWLAMIDNKGSYYFITNRHIIDFFKDTPVDKMKFWRPGIDSEAYRPSTMEGAASVGRDLAVIKCTGGNSFIQVGDALNWQDNVRPRKGQALLTVGYPEAFKDINNPEDLLTCASFIEVEKVIDTQKGKWLAKGLLSSGGSGSPVIEVDTNGEPRVVGILYAAEDNLPTGKFLVGRKENVMYGCELEVGNLIKLLY